MEPVDANDQDISFEEALIRLEDIVQQLENEKLDLDRALVQYEEGVRIARRCLERLEAAELRVQELTLDRE